MTAPLRLRVVEKAREFACPLSSRVEIGRQGLLPDSNELEPGPLRLIPGADGVSRLILAWNSEVKVSQQQARLEPLPGGFVRVTNLSGRSSLAVSDLHDPLPPGRSADVQPPFTIDVDRRTLYVGATMDFGGPRTLAGKTVAPGSRLVAGLDRPSFPNLESPQFDQLIDWLQTYCGVLQSTSATDDFMAEAAEALVTIVQLHSGRVLLRRGTAWDTVAGHRAQDLADFPDLSDSVLTRVVEDRRAVWIQPPAVGETPVSLRNVNAVVAAPLLNPAGEVIGALYGELRRGGPPTNYGDDKLRALLVEMLANTVSGGLARREIERERTLFRQFFPPELAARLSREPELIREGREADVTVLFCDVRGFSSASARLGPADTFRWISEIMGKLSGCVQDEQGVVVDYIGDELMAMWGAPEAQADQKRRAARAALAMLGAIKELNDWSTRKLGIPTKIGVGLNSGPAQVGNTGSSFKLKYGPLGDTVNVASRIQGATKYLKCPLLVTREALDAPGGPAIARRVVTARLVGVDKERELYELASLDSDRGEFFPASESALKALEGGRFADAAQQAATLLRSNPGDGPLQLTLARASRALVTDGADFDPVWALEGK